LSGSIENVIEIPSVVLDLLDRQTDGQKDRVNLIEAALVEYASKAIMFESLSQG